VGGRISGWRIRHSFVFGGIFFSILRGGGRRQRLSGAGVARGFGFETRLQVGPMTGWVVRAQVADEDEETEVAWLVTGVARLTLLQQVDSI
jgi:hypothetical protein